MLYPLRFHPLYKQYIWGGRKFETSLGRVLAPGQNYAESWEICDHGADQSVAAFGPLAGMTLNALLANHGRELLGLNYPQAQFPLMAKFLDARQTLSVQVHPTDAQAARLQPPDSGKTEAWMVLETEPESVIYAGLKPGVDRAKLEQAIRQGRCADCLHSFQPRPGDCVFIPAGTVHSLGAGSLVAEIQQSSDTTFRLFDWNRTEPDGKPRALHIEQGLESVDFQHGPVNPRQGLPAGRDGVSRLVECEKFVLDKLEFHAPFKLCGDNRFHILFVLDGAMSVEGDPAPSPVPKGGTVLLPACLGPVALAPQNRTVVLNAYLPD